MLDQITSIDFTPRKNLKGNGIGANWVFLLPSLDLQTVLCIGAPAADMLPALKLISSELICTRPIADPEVLVRSVDQIPDSSVDLVYICERRGVQRAELQRVLKPGAWMYYEYFGTDSLELDTTAHTVNCFFLTPTLGNVQTAVPIGQAHSKEFLFRRQLLTSTIRHQTVDRLAKRLRGKSISGMDAQDVSIQPVTSKNRSLKPQLAALLRRTRDSVLHSAHRMEQGMLQTAWTNRWVQRNGAIIQSENKSVGELPEYLLLGAKECGLDIRDREWAFVARGDYPSQKLLFYLFEPDQESPSIVIKMVRDSEYNERLEREYRGLDHLTRSDFIHRTTVPQVFFRSYHRGLFFLGESVLDGQPFAQKSTLDPQCQYAHFVTQWMIDLGTQTQTQAGGAELAALLTPLFQRFIDVYQPDASQQQFLQKQLDRLQQAEHVPLVLRHGDPGLQNLLITADEKVAFLDWENAELRGMPLWDLFYFLSAYGMKAGQVRSHLSNLESYERFFLTASPFEPFILDAIHRYCESLGIHRDLFAPLFHLFWMYRALKQSPMLEPAKVHQALTWQILSLNISRENTLIIPTS